MLKIIWKYRAQFRVHRETIKLAERLLGKELMTWNDGDLFSILCICIMAMTAHKMQSMRLLCRNGLAKDAVVLLRVLFEDIVNFNYMDNDKKRIRDFMDYDTWERLKISKWAPKKTLEDSVKFAARVSELEQMWNKVKHKYTYTTGKRKGEVFDKWSGKNLWEMVKEVKGEELYKYLYKYLSSFVHFNSTTFNEYVLGAKKDHIIVEIGLSDQFIPEVLVSSSALVLESLIRVINMCYKLRLDKEIEDLSRKVLGLKGSSRLA